MTNQAIQPQDQAEEQGTAAPTTAVLLTKPPAKKRKAKAAPPPDDDDEDLPPGAEHNSPQVVQLSQRAHDPLTIGDKIMWFLALMVVIFVVMPAIFGGGR